MRGVIVACVRSALLTFPSLSLFLVGSHQARLTASRYLRVRKLVNHVRWLSCPEFQEVGVNDGHFSL